MRTIAAAAWAVAIALNSPNATARAQPSSITCYFTEPFIRTVIDPRRNTLTVIYDVEPRSQVEQGMSLQVVSPTELRLKNKAGQLIQDLRLSHKGSDGMSDQVYPYEARWTPQSEDLPQILYGGCK